MTRMILSLCILGYLAHWVQPETPPKLIRKTISVSNANAYLQIPSHAEVRNPSEFGEAVRQTSVRLGVNPTWLLWVMDHESTLDPQARFSNSPTAASGLIQFTPIALSEINRIHKTSYSIEQVRRMDEYDQLSLTELYFSSAIEKYGLPQSFIDTYLLVFYPKAKGQGLDYVIGKSGQARYRLNRGMDYNRDGVLTVADIKNFLAAKGWY